MPLLDIEKAIKSEEVESRFRLVMIASQRARELNNPTENTLPAQCSFFDKVTTNALDEIINEKVEFKGAEETPEES